MGVGQCFFWGVPSGVCVAQAMGARLGRGEVLFGAGAGGGDGVEVGEGSGKPVKCVPVKKVAIKCRATGKFAKCGSPAQNRRYLRLLG